MFATRWRLWESALTLVGVTLLTGPLSSDGSATQEGPRAPKIATTEIRTDGTCLGTTRPIGHGEAKAHFIMEAGRVREFGVALLVSRDLLESETDLEEALSQVPGGYLPGAYRIYWTEDRRERRVALTHLPV